VFGDELPNCQKEFAALRDLEPLEGSIEGLTLLRGDIGGLKNNKIPARTVLMHVQLARLQPSVPIRSVAQRDEPDEGLMLARSDPIDFNLRPRGIRDRGRRQERKS